MRPGNKGIESNPNSGFLFGRNDERRIMIIDSGITKIAEVTNAARKLRST